jgi:CheY-like chemotaxis protein
VHSKAAISETRWSCTEPEEDRMADPIGPSEPSTEPTAEPTAEPPEPPEPSIEPLRVLVVDNDPHVAELVSAILTDEGYEVATLEQSDHASIAAAVGRIEPDCILLDSAEGPEFGGSWSEAAYLSKRSRRVPTIMFTAHADDAQEAQERTTDRAVTAEFAAIVPKPFMLDELLDGVASAAGRSDRFDRSEEGDRDRTAALVDDLERAHATDIRTSNRREWATFVSPNDHRIYQLYWWQRLGRYMLGRYDDDARMELIGQFFERREAIEAAIGSR